MRDFLCNVVLSDINRMKKIYMRGIICKIQVKNADKNRNRNNGGNYVKSNHCR